MQLITKFNSIIRSRILWGAFAVVISITFVGSYSAGGGGCAEQDDRNSEGVLMGQVVTREALDQAGRFVRHMHKMEDEGLPDARAARKLAWQRLAMLAMAQRMQIRVTADEVAAEIQKQRVFSAAFDESGRVDDARFRGIIERFYDMDKASFLQFIREQLTIQKFTGLLGFGVWTSPSESSALVQNYVDKFVVEYAPLPLKNLVSITNVTAAQAEAFFDSHTNLFVLPAQRSVRFVAFPLSNHLAQAAVTEKEVKDYYEDHIEDYVEKSTNGTEVAIPLDRVFTNVQEVLAMEKARTKAEMEGTRFMDLLLANRGRKGLPFEEAAARQNLAIHTSVLFTAEEPVPGLTVGLEFNEQAFGLDPDDPERLFSDPVSTTDGVYVLTYLTNVPPRVPSFGEVADKVMPMALTNALETAYALAQTNVFDKVSAAVKGGTRFKDAVASLSLGLTTTVTRAFSAYDAQMQYYSGDTSNAIEYAFALVPRLMNRFGGEVLDPIPVKEDLSILAHVSERLPGDMSDTDQLKSSLSRDRERTLASMLIADWAEQLLPLAGFKDFHPLPDPTESDEFEKEAPAGAPSTPPTQTPAG